MSESILNTIKKMIGFTEEYDVFDTDLITLINGCFSTLYQLHVGPSDHAYKITSADNLWSEFLSDNENIESVKTYIFLKAKLIFDPPANSFIVTAYNDQIKELEWRLNAECDPGWLPEAGESEDSEEEDDGL